MNAIHLFAFQQLPDGIAYNKLKMNMNWGGISCALICAIPIVAIICDAVKKVFEMKYKKENDNEL